MELSRQEALENLRQYVIRERKRRRMSQRDLANAAGVSHALISHLESARGRVPKQDSLEAIAKGLGVSYETLDRINRGLPPIATPGAVDAVTNPRITEALIRFSALPMEAQAELVEDWVALLERRERRAGT